MSIENYNNIPQASDMRLKKDVSNIEDAVEKVKSLSAFTYKLNEVAESIGFRNIDEVHFGLSAQELLLSVPEVVAKLPADNNYYAVKYDRLVVLLIAAIKEQQTMIDDLKTQIENISGQ